MKTPQEIKVGIGSSKIRKFKKSYVDFDQFNKGGRVKCLCYLARYSMFISIAFKQIACIEKKPLIFVTFDTPLKFLSVVHARNTNLFEPKSNPIYLRYKVHVYII